MISVQNCIYKLQCSLVFLIKATEFSLKGTLGPVFAVWIRTVLHCAVVYGGLGHGTMAGRVRVPSGRLLAWLTSIPETLPESGLVSASARLSRFFFFEQEITLSSAADQGNSPSRSASVIVRRGEAT